MTPTSILPTTRAFVAITNQSSKFLIKFDLLDTEDSIKGTSFGRTLIVGKSNLVENKIEVRGIGALPEVGGKIVVSDTPYYYEEVEEEIFPVYPSEVIVSVREINLERILNECNF